MHYIPFLTHLFFTASNMTIKINQYLSLNKTDNHVLLIGVYELKGHG